MDEDRHRLFDVNILARGTREDRNGTVPRIGRLDDDRLKIHIVQQASKVAIGLSAATAGGDAFIQPSSIHIRHHGTVGVWLFREIADVLSHNQAVSDETELNATVRAQFGRKRLL